MVKKILLLFLFSITLSSFSQEKQVDKLVASPNPFTNNTTISFNSKSEQVVIFTVRNVLGKTLYKKELNISKGRNSYPFNRDDLKSGMYIYAIQSNKNIISKRFVIK